MTEVLECYTERNRKKAVFEEQYLTTKEIEKKQTLRYYCPFVRNSPM